MEILMLLIGVAIGAVAGVVLTVLLIPKSDKSVGLLVVDHIDSEKCMFNFMFNDFKDIADKHRIVVDVTHVSHQ